MANSNRVGARIPGNFGSYLFGTSGPITLNATGNAVANISCEGTSFIVRRVTVTNASGSVASANIAIYSSNNGSAANIVTANTVLSVVTGATKFQDLTLSSTANTTIYTTGAFFVCVNTVSGNTSTAVVNLYGDVVTP